MAHFWRSSRGIVIKSLQFQKCFPRCLMTPSSDAKPVGNVPPSEPDNRFEESRIHEVQYRRHSFEVRKLFTVKDLFDARVHCGHTMATLNADMKKFILEERTGTLIFDLEKTAECLEHALEAIARTAFWDDIILFVSRYEQNTLSIENTVVECGNEYFHTQYLEYGIFFAPNPNIRRLTDLIFHLRPDLIIFLDTLGNLEGHQAVLKAHELDLTTVGVVDTNCSPSYITYPIPGNDHTPEALELYCKLFKEAILRGLTEQEELYKDLPDM